MTKAATRLFGCQSMTAPLRRVLVRRPEALERWREYGWRAEPDAKDIAVVVLDEEVSGIQPALLPSAGLLDQLANDGALKGQSFTAVGYGATERTHEPGSGAPVFGEGGTRMYSVSSFSALTKNFLRLSQNPSTGDSGACYGDSGGPNFLGDSQVIASITITGDIPCRSRNVTYRLDTPTAREFLGQFVTLP